MARELILLVAGFGLTTVLGGLLGSWLQRRSWDHQNAARLVEEELRSADGISQRLSQLLDKRLYRMLRLYYALYPTPDRQVSRDVLEQRLAEYDAALFDWNDQLNLNLAKVGTYFGEPARDWLAHEIYESFRMPARGWKWLTAGLSQGGPPRVRRTSRRI